MSASLRIYFCGSMRAGRQDVDLYGTLVEKLGQYGEVLTPFVADKSITHLGRKVDFFDHAYIYIINVASQDNKVDGNVR